MNVAGLRVPVLVNNHWLPVNRRANLFTKAPGNGYFLRMATTSPAFHESTVCLLRWATTTRISCAISLGVSGIMLTSAKSGAAPGSFPRPCRYPRAMGQRSLKVIARGRLCNHAEYPLVIAKACTNRAS